MKLRRIIFVLLLAAEMGTAWGATNSSSYDCGAKESSEAFNSCLIRSLSADFFSPNVDNGRWVYSLHPNVKDQKQSAFVATLLSSSKVHYLDKPVSMTVRCNNKKTELEIHWDGVRIKEGEAKIFYRFDQKAKHPARWAFSTAEQSVFVSNPAEFIHELAKEKSFRIQVSSADSPTINATFYPDGLSNLLPQMKGICF